MLALDSNVLVYAADSLAGPRHDQAQMLVRAALDVGAKIPQQCLLEFCNVSLRKARRSVAQTAPFVRGWSAQFEILLPGASTVEDVLCLLARHKLSTWDARVLAVCAANRCEVLFSEDMQDGAHYGGVTVIDPFNAENAAEIARLLTA